MEKKKVESMSGRKAEAARNDGVILAAAREVFTANPDAPISAVAKRAGVGISALYRRYESKEGLLQKLSADGLDAYVSAVEDALADEGNRWEAFVRFMRRAVDAETNSLTSRLAGTFTPTEELYREGQRARELNERLFERVREAGVVRGDLVFDDISLLLEQLSSVRIGDKERTLQLRHRYLALFLEAIRAPAEDELPGPPPSWEETGGRWQTHAR